MRTSRGRRAAAHGGRHGAVGVGTLLVLAPLLLAAGFLLGRWSAPVGAGVPPTPGETPYRVTAPAPRSATATAHPATMPIQVPRFDPGPQELIPLPGGPGQGQGPGQEQFPGQGQAPAPGQGQNPGQGQGDCMLFMFRDGRLFQFGGPGMPGQPGTQPSPFGFGGPGNGPGGGPGGPQELYPLQPAPSPGLPAPNFPPPNFPPQVPSAPMPPPSMSQAPPAPGAAPATALPANEALAHPAEGRS